ncbi:putative DD41D transposase [Trichonephila clavipes]|uniref:Putative DD41D transposase n=1 Tax=Trichonephila clavipes TaxID=2585209 RepID=A0A8X6VV74_TRICX|nr:putative DD41D transposase [Trichonephila clavipes]
MVWEGISLGYRTDLHFFKRGFLTIARYRDEGLEHIVRLFASAVGPTFVLMDDNARPHRADIVDDYLEREGIARMAWLAYSTDFNRIENIWDALGRAESSSYSPTATLIELETALQEEWRLLNPAVVDHLIEIMVRRMLHEALYSLLIMVCIPLRRGRNVLPINKSASEMKEIILDVRGDRARLTCQVIYSQFGLAIHQNDHQARRRFVECAQNEIAVVPDFHKRILFSDEVHFWFNGYVNKQKCRIWSKVNPQVYAKTPLHPEKLTVWCALWAAGVIGPYFFKNDEGYNVTVNGDRYRAMITNFFIPELNNHDVQELWFQQDGATCHTPNATIDLLKDTFGDRLISRFVPMNWPPRSCDLTPLDYFLWGYVTSLVYADKP